MLEQIKDGSIIVLFKKTRYPREPKEVYCPWFWEMKWANGCILKKPCSWCYLQGTYRFRPYYFGQPNIKPYDKIQKHIEEFFKFVREPQLLNAGEICDSLVAEHHWNYKNWDTPFSKFIIDLFETQRRHKVLLLTKMTNISNLLDVDSHNQTIMSFSLNAKEVAERWESGAPSIAARIKAAKILHDAGYEVRIRIDPMVPVKDFEMKYLDLLEDVFRKFIPSRITLGSIRGLQSTINFCKDKSWTHYLTEDSKWGKRVALKDRVVGYSAIMNRLFYEHSYPYEEISLCKETRELWQELGDNPKKRRCNCQL